MSNNYGAAKHFENLVAVKYSDVACEIVYGPFTALSIFCSFPFLI